jgi:hypothetical protein
MPAMNVVRFRVKPGCDQQFLDHNRGGRSGFVGFLGGSIIKTGEQTYCLVGEWKNQQSLVNARPQMIALLDGMRGLLEDLGGGLGVTDPVSGDVVLRMPAAAAGKKAPGKAASKKAPAKKASAKKSAKKGASAGKAKKRTAKRSR